MISSVAERSHIATWATWLYTFFIAGALAFWFIPQPVWVSVANVFSSREPGWWTVRIGLWVIVGIWLYHYVTRAGLEEEKTLKVICNDRWIAWLPIALLLLGVGISTLHVMCLMLKEMLY